MVILCHLNCHNGTSNFYKESISLSNVQRETTQMIGVVIPGDSSAGCVDRNANRRIVDIIFDLICDRRVSKEFSNNSILRRMEIDPKKFHYLKIQDKIWTRIRSWVPCKWYLINNRVYLRFPMSFDPVESCIVSCMPNTADCVDCSRDNNYFALLRPRFVYRSPNVFRTKNVVLKN